MYDFSLAIELFFAELFDCERVNVVMVHRFKGFLYRIEPDTEPGTYKIVKFDIRSGIAGYVCVASQTYLTESVAAEPKFNKQIDDPKGPEDKPAHQMISCPVNAEDDF